MLALAVQIGAAGSAREDEGEVFPEPEMKKGRLEADLFKNRWCPGEDSNLHDVATART
ncbi:hypothetical protein BCEP4_60090 [Burkholderia cepacia]|nr:hypothetical protein BCEP4_60090 [Burkholderia cepacia]